MVNAKVIVDEWLSAIEARDVKRLLDALADEFQLQVDGGERLIIGKETLSPDLDNLGVYESIQITREKLLVSGHDVACLVRTRATMGPTNLSLLGEELPTAGKRLDLLAALFVTVNDAGKITHLTRVRDNLAMTAQLGIPAERMTALIDKAREQMQRGGRG